MKRLLLTLTLVLGTLITQAMPYHEAREYAMFLTDKMAYELNLTPGQYEDAYRINLDYMLCVNHPSELYGHYWRMRDRDLGYILMDWQYRLFVRLDYFFRPLNWITNAWRMPIFTHYRHDHFFYARPSVYVSYRGGGHFDYGHRRPPHWNGGMSGHEPRGREAHPGYRPSHNQPGMHQPGGHQPGHNQPGMHQPSGNNHGSDRPGMHQPGNHNRPDVGPGNNHGGSRVNSGTRSDGGNRSNGGRSNGGGRGGRNGGRR